MNLLPCVFAAVLLPGTAFAHDDMQVHFHIHGFVIDAWDIAAVFAAIITVGWLARAAARSRGQRRNDDP